MLHTMLSSLPDRWCSRCTHCRCIGSPIACVALESWQTLFKSSLTCSSLPERTMALWGEGLLP